MNKLLKAILILSSFAITPCEATNFIVNIPGDTAPTTGGVPGDLRNTLNSANLLPGPHTVTFQLGSGNETISLQGPLPILNLSSLPTATSINGSNTSGSGTPITIDGGSIYPGFFAHQDSVSLSNMTVANTTSRGGNGGASAGGGAGLGGGLFINKADVVIFNMTFNNNNATGGNGNTTSSFGGGGGGMWQGNGGASGSFGGGGGGGLGGQGGNGLNFSNQAGGGGGGGIAPGGNGGNGYSASPVIFPTNGSDGGGYGGASGGAGGGGGTAAGGLGGFNAGGGGGGGSNGSLAGSGGGGGGNGGTTGATGTTGVSGGNGGAGGFGGGGGGNGGRFSAGGAGGFGGGGGGSADGAAGSGGFGGGGGAPFNALGGNGGFGAGAGTRGGIGGVGGGSGPVGTNVGGGGGGGGLGGAIFVNGSTAYGDGGGRLTVAGNLSITNGSVAAGTGFKNGAAAAQSIFATTNAMAPLTFTPQVGETILIDGTVGDDSPFTLPGNPYQPGTAAGEAILMNGPGTLILNAANTYSGGTELSNGVVGIGNNQAFGLTSTTIDVTGNATLRSDINIDFPYLIAISNATVCSLDSNGNTFSLNNVISGLGGVDKIGDNRAILNAANTYTGGTAIHEGVLQVTTTTLPVATVQPSVSIFADSTLEFVNLSSGTYSGGIANDGLLLNTGVDTLTLSGLITGDGLIEMDSPDLMQFTVTSAYTGDILIDMGTVELIQNGIDSYGGDVDLVTSNTELIKSGTGQLTMSGIITGSGEVDIDQGKLILTSAFNNYQGGTYVNPGSTLEGTSNSLQSDIFISSATVIFNQNFNGSFNGQLVGPSSTNLLVKRGTGTLIFNTNQSTYGGTTNVEQGTLLLNNAIGGIVNVLSSATLRGNAQIFGNLNIASGGTIAPGNSIGTISVFGNYTQAAGSTYEAEIDSAGNSDLITATGTAMIDGNLLVIPLNGVINEEAVYVLLHADGGVSGHYASVISTNPSLVPSIIYTPTDVLLKTQHILSIIALTHNEKQVAHQLINVQFPSPELQTIINELIALSQNPDTAEEARVALDQMSGQQYTTLLTATEIGSSQFLKRLFDPLRSIVTTHPCYSCCCMPCTYNDSTFNAWIEGGGGQSFVKGNRNTRGFNNDTFEVTFGAQSTFRCNWTAGLAASYAHDDIDYKVAGTGKNRTWYGGLYGLYRPQDYYILADLAIGYADNSIKRPIHIGSLNYHARSNPKIYQAGGYIEGGYDLCAIGLLAQPFIGLEVGHFSLQKVKERGAYPINLDVSGKNYTNAFTRLGVHLSTQDICFLSLSVDLAWKYRVTSLRNSIVERFQSFGDSFKITGIPWGRNSFDYAATISADIGNCWNIYVEVAGENWPQANTYNVLGGVEFSW